MKSIFSILLFSVGIMLFPIQGVAQETDAPSTTQTLEQTQDPTNAEAEAESPVSAVLEGFLVQITENEDGTLKEELVPASTASPGDILQYDTTYTNVSDIELTGLTANGQIPAGTTYLDSSAIITVDATFEVLIDSENWQEVPAYKTIINAEGEEVRVEATAQDYLELRWRILGALEPETTVRATYRVQVNN